MRPLGREGSGDGEKPLAIRRGHRRVIAHQRLLAFNLAVRRWAVTTCALVGDIASVSALSRLSFRMEHDAQAGSVRLRALVRVAMGRCLAAPNDPTALRREAIVTVTDDLPLLLALLDIADRYDLTLVQARTPETLAAFPSAVALVVDAACGTREAWRRFRQVAVDNEAEAPLLLDESGREARGRLRGQEACGGEVQVYRRAQRSALLQRVELLCRIRQGCEGYPHRAACAI